MTSTGSTGGKTTHFWYLFIRYIFFFQGNPPYYNENEIHATREPFGQREKCSVLSHTSTTHTKYWRHETTQTDPPRIISRSSCHRPLWLGNTFSIWNMVANCGYIFLVRIYWQIFLSIYVTVQFGFKYGVF